MKYVEVVANQGSSDTVAAIAEKVKASDFRLGMVGEDGMQAMRLLVADNQVQNLLDLLENVLGAQPTARIMVLPVEVSLPRLGVDQEKYQDSAISLREALHQEVSKGARLDMNYIVLLMLSTVVAAIGMIENNVAVVIGAMVIAPLLTPNLALSLGTALGDVELMRKSAITLLVGIGLAMLMSAALGAWWPADLSGKEFTELKARTEAGWSAVALALASGAAAALSLTSGLSSVLVGVMVAVALLPPASTVGIMLGQGNPGLAFGAALLLAINIVCVNLASKVVFYFKDIRPRKRTDKDKASGAMRVYILVWALTLLLLMLVVYLRTLSGWNEI